MVSRDETCAITRLPIRHNDKIVAVGLFGPETDRYNADFKAARNMCSTYELMMTLIYPTEYPKAIRIIHGYYTGEGGVSDKPDSYEEIFFPPNATSAIDMLYFLLHDTVWQEFRKINTPEATDMKVLYSIVTAAMDARIQLFDTSRILGMQFSGREFLTARSFLNDVTDKALNDLWNEEKVGSP